MFTAGVDDLASHSGLEIYTVATVAARGPRSRLMSESESSSSIRDDHPNSISPNSQSYKHDPDDSEQVPAWIRYMPRSLLSKTPQSTATTSQTIPGSVSPVDPTKPRCSMRRSANRFSTATALQRMITIREKRKRELGSAESAPESDETRMRRKKSRGVSVVECETLLSFATL